jgi:hypothetical protein
MKILHAYIKEGAIMVEYLRVIQDA